MLHTLWSTMENVFFVAMELLKSGVESENRPSTRGFLDETRHTLSSANGRVKGKTEDENWHLCTCVQKSTLRHTSWGCCIKRNGFQNRAFFGGK